MKSTALTLWSVASAFTLFLSPVYEALARRDPWPQRTDESSHNGFASSHRRYSRGENSDSKISLLIKYKSATVQRVGSTFYASDGLQRLASGISNISRRHKIARVEIDANEKDVVISELLNTDDVELVEEDFRVYAMPHTSSHHVYQEANLRRSLAETQQEGLDMIQAPKIWSVTAEHPEWYNHTSIKVCIIDTGYDYGHEDLPTAGVTGTETIYGGALNDGNGHGTHCAGVIGAIGFNKRGVVGVNPDPDMFSFHISKALNAQGIGTASSLIQGIEGCISSGSKIISMSVGGGPNSNIFRQIYKEAYDQGVLIVAAAGNDGTTAHDYPASFPHVISVGAVDPNGAGRAVFSNYNDQIEIVAPGVDVMSTGPSDSYRSLSGTSMATPYVAGVAALVWSYFPECSNNQIRNILALTAKRLSPEGSCDEYTGYGMIQAKEAFDALDKWGCEAPGVDPTPLSDGGFGGCAQALPEFRSDLNVVPTSLPTFKPTMKPFDNNLSNSSSCQKLLLDLLTDKMAIETSWVLKRVEDENTTEVVKSGPPSNMNYSPETKYLVAASDCLVTGSYEFTIYDMFGDGIAEPGYYTISLNGEALASGSNFGSYETTNFTVNTGFLPRQDPVDEPSTMPIWRTLLSEDFEDGFGEFNHQGSEISHKSSIFGRRGVAFIQVATASGQPSLSTEEIKMEEPYSFFEVVMSYRTANLDDGQQICLEYSPNNATDWNRAECWRNGFHFENGVWNDDVSAVFQVQDAYIESVKIRLILTDGTYMDRLFVDRVKVSGMLQLNSTT